MRSSSVMFSRAVFRVVGTAVTGLGGAWVGVVFIVSTVLDADADSDGGAVCQGRFSSKVSAWASQATKEGGVRLSQNY